MWTGHNSILGRCFHCMDFGGGKDGGRLGRILKVISSYISDRLSGGGEKEKSRSSCSSGLNGWFHIWWRSTGSIYSCMH